MTEPIKPSINRREMLVASVLAPLGLRTGQRGAPAAATAASPAPVGPPPYKLSINIELMFRSANLSRADRIRAIAARGFTGYSFWSANADDRAAMLKAQQETGLTCVSIVGTGSSGGTTGFTRPGAGETLLNEINDLKIDNLKIVEQEDEFIF